MLLAGPTDRGGQPCLTVSRRRPGPRSAGSGFALRVRSTASRRPQRRPAPEHSCLNPPQQRPRHRLGIGIEHDLRQHPRGRRRHFLGHLVGLELDQRIVDRDRVADLLEPRADDRLGAFLLVGNADLDHVRTPPAGRSRRGFVRPRAAPIPSVWDDAGSECRASSPAPPARRGRGMPRRRPPRRSPRRTRRCANPRGRSGSGACRRTLSSTMSRSHGIERAQVDDVGADSLRRGLAARHHRAPGDDRDRVALAGLLRPAERQHDNRRPATAAAPRLSSSIARCSKNSTGSLPRKARAQQPDRILGIGRHRDLPAGIVDELHLVGLECHGSPHLKKPPGTRSTIGAAKRLWVRQRIVPQSWICSVAGSAYLRNWISGTGISPASAMPTARPTMPFLVERGVEHPRRRHICPAGRASPHGRRPWARHPRRTPAPCGLAASSWSSTRRIAVTMLIRWPSAAARRWCRRATARRRRRPRCISPSKKTLLGDPFAAARRRAPRPRRAPPRPAIRPRARARPIARRRSEARRRSALSLGSGSRAHSAAISASLL